MQNPDLSSDIYLYLFFLLSSLPFLIISSYSINYLHRFGWWYNNRKFSWSYPLGKSFTLLTYGTFYKLHISCCILVEWFNVYFEVHCPKPIPLCNAMWNMEGQLKTTFSGTFVVCYSSIYFYLLLKRVKFQKLFHPQPLSCVHCGRKKSRYLD